MVGVRAGGGEGVGLLSVSFVSFVGLLGAGGGGGGGVVTTELRSFPPVLPARTRINSFALVAAESGRDAGHVFRWFFGVVRSR